MLTNLLNVSLLAVTSLARLSSASPLPGGELNHISGYANDPPHTLSKRTLFPLDKTPRDPEKAEAVSNNADAIVPAIIEDIRYAQERMAALAQYLSIAENIAGREAAAKLAGQPAAPLAPYTVYGIPPEAYVLVPVPLVSEHPGPLPTRAAVLSLPVLVYQQAENPSTQFPSESRHAEPLGVATTLGVLIAANNLNLARMERVGVVTDVADFEQAGREAVLSSPLMKGRQIGANMWYSVISSKLKAKREWKIFAKYGLSTYPLNDM